MSDVEDDLTLIRAIRNHEPLDEIRELIQSGIDVNKQADYGSTALMVAAEHGGGHATEMMRLLVDAGADTNKKDADGDTVLMYAIWADSEHSAGMMRLLLDAGADANKQDVDGNTALMITAEHGDEHAEAMMRVLVAHSVTLPPDKELPSETSPELALYVNCAQNWNPIHRAADARDFDALVECLSNGERPDDVVDSPHQDMRTALSIAESTSYPTAQPVCERCLALLRPSLVKGGTPSGSLFGGGGGGGSDCAET